MARKHPDFTQTDPQFGAVIAAGESVAPQSGTRPEKHVGKIGEVRQAFGNWVRVKFPKDRELHDYRVTEVLRQAPLEGES